LLEVFLRDLRSVQEARQFAIYLAQSKVAPEKWSGWIALLRAPYIDEVDSELWGELAEFYRMDRYTGSQIALARALVDLWRTRQPQSPTSRRVLADLGAGISLEELLTRDN
jgi:hypothetical protein